MIKSILVGLVRHLLTTGGGFLVADGIATQDQLHLIAGGATALVGILASVYSKYKGAK